MRKSQIDLTGFVLIELLVAIFLSLLLTSFIFEIWLASQRSVSLQNDLIHIQNNARTVIDILSEDISKAGYIGCAKLTADFPVGSYAAYSLTTANKLTGSATEITIRHGGFPAAALSSNMSGPSTLNVNDHVHFKTRDILFIADCKHAEIFQAASTSSYKDAQKIIATQPLHHLYGMGAEVSHLVINKYSVVKTNRVNSKRLPVFALYIEDLNGNYGKQELVEGINQLNILYTMIINGKMVDVPASEIADWSTVIGVMVDFEAESGSIKKKWYMYKKVDNA